MSTNARQWKYVAMILAVSVLLTLGMASAMTVIAAPPERPAYAPLAVSDPFTIVGHGPVTHAVGVGVNANITASFSAAVNTSTINTGTWVVHGGFSGVMTGTYAAPAPSTLAGFNPIRPYFAGEQVHVIATSGISNVGGLPLDPLQWNFTAGPVQSRCVGGFTDIGAALTGVYYSAVAWGDYDNDRDLDILLTGYAGGGWTSRIYRNDGDGFTSLDPGLADVAYSSVAWGDYDNDGDLDILLAGHTGTKSVTYVYNNDDGVFTDISAGLMGVYNSSVDWGDYDNDGDLDILLTGDTGAFRVTKVYINEEGSFVDSGIFLTGVSGGTAIWGDYDNDGDLDFLLAGYSVSGKVTQIYRNDGVGFTAIGATLTDVDASSASWGDYDNDGDLDILLTGNADGGSVAQIYRNDGSDTFVDIGAGLTGVFKSSVAWGDYDNDGDLDILLTGNKGSKRVSMVYRNDGGIFNDIKAGLTIVDDGSVVWGDYDNDGDLDILLTGESSGNSNVAKIYRNDNCADLTVSKQPSTLAVRPGDAVSYTIAFTNSGPGPAANATITDTLPAGITVSEVTTNTTGGITLTQVASSSELVWSAVNVPAGAGGLITLTGVVDAGLTGTTVTTNTVVATTAFSESTLANNVDFANVTVIEPASLNVTKVVVGPAPGVDWPFSGTSGIGAFSLPAGGGGTSFTLDPGGYTLNETSESNYAVAATCSDGSTGADQVNLTLTPGAQVSCIFTNTYNAYTLAVNSVGSGNVSKQPDEAAYAHGELVQLTANEDAGWTFSGWSGDVVTDVNPVAVTMDSSKAITATFEEDSSQEGGTVQGTVVDENDNGIPNVQVALSNEAAVRAALLLTDTTEIDGSYGFENVPAGAYTLTIVAAGYRSPKPKSVEVAEGESKTVEPVVLKAAETSHSLYLPAMQSSSTTQAGR